MSILSFEFLVFACGTLLVTYVLPCKVRWCALLAASAVFYAFSGVESCAYLLCAALLAYGSARWMEKLQGRGRKALLLATAFLLLGAMLLFKYFDKLTAAIGGVLQGEDAFCLAVPLGLSYFSFQLVGYVVDVSRGQLPAERNFLRFLLFTAYFPQMTQGPIAPYSQLAPQLKAPEKFDEKRFVSGFLLLLWGYLKKLVIADRLLPATLVSPEQPGWTIAFGLLLYMLRLYADFSGGMDVVRGLSRMLGVELLPNFTRPFFSKSVAEYWRRWHSTLGAWFRTYLFYPMTISHAGVAVSAWGKKHLGKKVGKGLAGALATVVIFVAIGLWHMLSWNAVLYGLYFGLLLGGAMLAEPGLKVLRKKLHINPKNKLWQGFCILRTVVLLWAAQYFACAQTAGEAFALLRGTFANPGKLSFAAQLCQVMNGTEWLIAGIGAALLLAVDVLSELGHDMDKMVARAVLPVRWLLLLLLIVAVLVFGCYGEDFNAASFLYTQF